MALGASFLVLDWFKCIININYVYVCDDMMQKFTLFLTGLLLCGAGVLYCASEEDFSDELTPEELVFLGKNRLTRMLDENPNLLHARCNERDWTLLHYAVARNSLDAAKILVQHGALVNAKADSPRKTMPLYVEDTQYTPDPGRQKMIQLYLVLSGAQVDDDVEWIWKRRQKQSLRGLQKEYREKQQKAIEEMAGFPKVLAALILDFEKGKEAKTQPAATDGSEKSEQS